MKDIYVDGRVCLLIHCDGRILHAPGECLICDKFPAQQKLREAWQINFTGHHDPDKVPCPSEFFRSIEDVHTWGNNQPDIEPATGPGESSAWHHLLAEFREYFKARIMYNAKVAELESNQIELTRLANKIR